MPFTMPSRPTALRVQRLLAGGRLVALGCGLGRRKNGDSAAGPLNGLDGRLGGAGNSDIHLRSQLAFRQEAHAIPGVLEETGFLHCSGVDSLARVQAPCLDRGLQALQVDLDIVAAENVVEAALRQAAVQRHLSALEALDCDTAPGLLTLVALTGSLAQAGTDATPKALARFARAGIVAQLIQLHLITSLDLGLAALRIASTIRINHPL